MESPPLDARTREQFPRFFWDLGLRRGAEIGVFDGSYLVEFCKQGFEMIGVDLWEPYPGYDDYKRARTLHSAYHDAVARTGAYQPQLIRGASVEVASRIPDRSLDFVYIDANHHYDPVLADLRAWVPKVRPGGIVSGHDFVEPVTPSTQVATAVRAFTDAFGIDRWFVTEEPVPSFFWVVP